MEEAGTLIRSRREGFSLVEVIVAMVMLAVVVSSLAMLTTLTAQRSLDLANHTGRQALTLAETNRIASMKYDTIAQLAAGCDTISLDARLQYRRCLSFTQGTRFREVRAIITPLRTGTGAFLIYADTISVRRVADAVSNPLFTP